VPSANDSLQIINFQKPFSIHVDASDYAVAGILTQPGDDGAERLVEFMLFKLFLKNTQNELLLTRCY